MKNYIKNKIVAILGIMFLFGLASSAQAASIWNNSSSDCPSINVANYTTNTGYGSPCWSGTSVNASAGDIVNVKVYYHNTSGSTATNVRIKLFADTGSSTRHSFSAQITSDQGNLYTGNVYINTSSSQSLSLLSTKWYPNQSSSNSSLLNGQSSGDVLSSNGLYIGTISSGWSSQGSINVSFKVSNKDAVCNDSSASNYGNVGSCIYTQNSCVINSFRANDTSINYPESSTLYWSTSNCSSVYISNIGNVNSSGSRAVYPSSTKTYTISAYGYGGTQTDAVTIRVSNGYDYYNDNDSSCRIDSFTASDTSIEGGDDVTLRWRTTGCDEVNITSLGDVDDDGNDEVSPSSDKTYYIKVYKDGDLINTRSVKIYVDEDNNDDDDDGFCKIDSFTAKDTSIDKGDEATLKWRTTDCDEVYLSGVGYVNEDDEEDVYPYSRTTYTLKAYGDGGTRTKTVTISVNNVNRVIATEPIVTPVYNNGVVTTLATNVSSSGAQLNGLITDSDYKNSNVYFEYGRTVDLGSRTSSRQTNGNTNINDYINGLSSDTVYFFQAVAENSKGSARGSIEVFKTAKVATQAIGKVTNTKQTVTSKTVYGSTSPVVLDIKNQYKNIQVGDVIDYTVYYKNISSSELGDPMIQVYIPEGIIVTNLSAGTYSEDDRTVSVPVDDLNPNDEGEVYIKAEVEDINSKLAQIVTTATLIYTNPNGAQENAMAYVLNNPKQNSTNSLGAAAFLSGIFDGWDLIGWLLFIILILLVIIISRHLFDRYNNKKTN